MRIYRKFLATYLQVAEKEIEKNEGLYRLVEEPYY